MILRARVVLPVAQPAIVNGAVEISDRRITAVGSWKDFAARPHSEVTDLGEVVLMPGLINAHCHLDYTNLAGEFPPPRVFTDWLKLITTAKSLWEHSDYVESWRNGAQMLLRTGTTTVADIEAVPQLLPAAWKHTPLRVISFLEMIGLTNRRAPQAVLQEALDKIKTLKASAGRVGLSPHAPYTTLPELLRLNAAAAQRRNWLLTTHLAESALEFEMFAHGKGEMYDWIRRSGRDMSDCGLGSPVQHLARCGLLGSNLLAVHVNYLAPRDAALLGRHQVSVVHCPRSHFYFKQDPFPLQRLKRAGVNICLGTDSLASVYKARRQTVELNMFEEMQVLAQRNPSLSPRSIVRMATLNAARALHQSGQLGELSPGALADLIALPCPAKTRNVYEEVLHHSGNVSASLIGGKWAFQPPKD